MKTITKLPLVLLLLALWLAPAGPALAKGAHQDQVVFGDTYILESGETLDGSLLVFGGAAVVEEGASVTGDVGLIGGTLQIDGTADDVGVVGGVLQLGGTLTGDLILFGGTAHLGESAVVEGNVTIAGGSLEREAGAVIEGTVQETSSFPTDLVPPMLPFAPELPIPPVPPIEEVPSVRGFMSDSATAGLGLLTALFTVVAESLLLALLAALVALFLPNHTRRVAAAISEQPLTAGGVGCLTLLILVAAVVLLVGLMITIIFIPVSIALIGFGSIAFVAALLLGMIALGLETGNRLARAFNANWPMPLTAFLGTLLLGIVVNAIWAIFACFGWWAPFAVMLLALGGVVMTRFGVQSSRPPMAPVAGPPLPPPAPSTEPVVSPPPPPGPPSPPEPALPAEPATEPEPPQDASEASEAEPPEKPKNRRRSSTSG
jgi:hypothetical protein